MTSDGLAADRYLLEQLVRPVANLYRVSTVLPGGAAGEPVAFARQKRLALKEDLRVFADESEREELFRLKARRVVDVGGRYDVTAAGGERLGVLERRFGQSLLRTTWRVLDAEERELATASERSLALALARRVQDVLPLPYHFAIRVDGREIGEVRRLISLRDRYLLDLAGDVERRIDRRLGIALALALDALQSR